MDFPPEINLVSQYWSNVPITHSTDPDKTEGVAIGVSLHLSGKDCEAFKIRETPFGEYRLKPVGPQMNWKLFALANDPKQSNDMRKYWSQYDQDLLDKVMASKDGIMLSMSPPYKQDVRPIDVDIYNASKSLQIMIIMRNLNR